MLFSRLWPVVSGLVLCLSAAPVLGCYSGLIVIPTAETVGAGQYGLEAQMDGSSLGSGSTARILNTELGIGERWEAGVDFDLSKESDSRALLNCKCVFAQDQRYNTSFCVGTCNVARRFKQSPYLVATHDCSAFRVHLGEMHLEGNNCWFTGVDCGMGEHLTLMADYTSGDENCSSLGFNYQLNKDFGILGGVMFPNGDGDTLFTLHFCLGGSYRGPVGGI